MIYCYALSHLHARTIIVHPLPDHLADFNSDKAKTSNFSSGEFIQPCAISVQGSTELQYCSMGAAYAVTKPSCPMEKAVFDKKKRQQNE